MNEYSIPHSNTTSNSSEISFSSDDTIERCPHDSENPYSMISNALIRDEKISPACRWLIIYLLSNKPGWKIRVSQVATHVKSFMGRDSTYALFNEAIDAGYIKREEIIRTNKHGGGLKRYTYILSETPKFKKCFRYPENQDTGDQDTGSIACHNNIYKNEHKKNIMSEPTEPNLQKMITKGKIPQPIPYSKPDTETQKNITSASPPPSAAASEIFDLLWKEILKMKPDFKPPDKKKWICDIDRMLKIDKRDPDKTKDLIKKIFTDDFWRSTIVSPTSLRKSYDRLELKFNGKSSNSTESNRDIAEKISKKFPDEVNDFEVMVDGVLFKTKGSPIAIAVKFDDKEFKSICQKQLSYRKVKMEDL